MVVSACACWAPGASAWRLWERQREERKRRREREREGKRGRTTSAERSIGEGREEGERTVATGMVPARLGREGRPHFRRETVEAPRLSNSASTPARSRESARSARTVTESFGPRARSSHRVHLLLRFCRRSRLVEESCPLSGKLVVLSVFLEPFSRFDHSDQISIQIARRSRSIEKQARQVGRGRGLSARGRG